jgi:hypothetical protein
MKTSGGAPALKWASVIPKRAPGAAKQPCSGVGLGTTSANFRTPRARSVALSVGNGVFNRGGSGYYRGKLDGDEV